MSKNNRINQIEPLISKSDSMAVFDYLNSGGWATEHRVTRDFEKALGTYVNRKYAVAVPNGTIAIYLALIAAGIKKGDKVAVPNITMIATINAILWADAKPVLIDVEDDLTMSFEKLKKIKNLKAAIFVPLNGRVSNGLEIELWCKKKNITLIEDSAHALGSSYENGKMCGNLGDVSILSFTPHKIITMGQGGLVFTDNKNVYNKLIDLKTFNRRKDKLDWHKGFGLNFKITDIQATLGLSQFRSLSEKINSKRKIHKYYKDKIESEKYMLGHFKDHEVPWFIDLFCRNKKNLLNLSNQLEKLNIETRISYPALSKQAYLNKSLRGDLEYSERIHEKILWLPSSVTLTEEQISNIVNVINEL